jgi:hypothetical protein
MLPFGTKIFINRECHWRFRLLQIVAINNKNKKFIDLVVCKNYTRYFTSDNEPGGIEKQPTIHFQI